MSGYDSMTLGANLDRNINWAELEKNSELVDIQKNFYMEHPKYKNF